MLTPFHHFGHLSPSIALPLHSSHCSYWSPSSSSFSLLTFLLFACSLPPPHSCHCPAARTIDYHAIPSLVDSKKWCHPIISSPLIITALSPVILASFIFSSSLRMGSKDILKCRIFPTILHSVKTHKNCNIKLVVHLMWQCFPIPLLRLSTYFIYVKFIGHNLSVSRWCLVDLMFHTGDI